MGGKKSRAEWVEAAVDALAAGGVEKVRVEPLARALGVTKGSFYWHFTDRAALLDAVVDHWEQAGTMGVMAAIDGLDGGPRAQLEALWRLTSADERFDAELALRDWARHDPAVAERIGAVDEQRMRYLRKKLRALGCDAKDAERRALLMYSLLLGNHFIRAGHGRSSRARVLEGALDLLLSPPPPAGSA